MFMFSLSLVNVFYKLIQRFFDTNIDILSNMYTV